MKLKELLENRIKAENFQGIALRAGNQSEVHWWNPGDTVINKLILDLQIDKPVSFNCVNGNLRILDF